MIVDNDPETKLRPSESDAGPRWLFWGGSVEGFCTEQFTGRPERWREVDSRWAESVHGGLSIQPSVQRLSAVNRGIIAGNVWQKNHVELANRKDDIDRESIRNKTAVGARRCIWFLSSVLTLIMDDRTGPNNRTGPNWYGGPRFWSEFYLVRSWKTNLKWPFGIGNSWSNFYADHGGTNSFLANIAVYLHRIGCTSTNRSSEIRSEGDIFDSKNDWKSF